MEPVTNISIENVIVIKIHGMTCRGDNGTINPGNLAFPLDEGLYVLFIAGRRKCVSGHGHFTIW